MKLATLKQARQVLDLIAKKEIPAPQLQNILESGLLADLLEANVGEINRHSFRRLVGLKSLSKFNIWRGLTVGKEDVAQLQKNVAPYQEIGNGTSLMVQPGFFVSEELIGYRLVRTNLRDLGFTNGLSLDSFESKINEIGLALCPPEVGPQLRIDYSDQPNDDGFWVAMKPIENHEGTPCMFYVGREKGGSYVFMASLFLSSRIAPDSDFVFVLPPHMV